MDREERHRFNATLPQRDGLARMARSVAGRRARVVRSHRLRGGVDAATHAVRLEPGGWVVLKRTPGAGTLAREFERLQFVSRVAIETPSPIALDTEGAWFGHPAMVMSRVHGRSRIPDAPGEWIDDLARVLVTIHATPVEEDAPAVLHAPHAGIAWEQSPGDLPRNARVGALLETALSLKADIRAHPPRNVLLHHDFHHGNVTWIRSRIAAVLDWNEARLGPAVCDVAYCSVDLAMTHGTNAAERFVRSYEAAGGQVSDLRRWQALWTVSDMRWVGDWIGGFHEAGATHMTVPLLRRRLRAFADHVLASV